MRTRCCLALLLTTVAWAREDPRAAAREHYTRGTKAYDLGSYDEAIEELSLAYRMVDDPPLLYNIAQAHRLAGHLSEAIRFYNIFLTKIPGSNHRVEIEAKLEELKKALEQQHHAETMPPNHALPQVEPPPEKKPPPPVAVVAPPPTPPPLPPRPDPSLRRKKIAGVATLAVGAALAGIGAAFSALAVKDGQQLTALDRQHGTFDKGTEDAGRLDQDLGGALLGIGGAALVAGAVVTALGFRPRVAASLSAHQAGASLAWDF